MFGSVRRAGGGGAARTGRGSPPGLSFIGPDVVVSGDVASGAQLHIDGRVEGNVRCDTLIQGPGGTIAGHIVAETVHLAGLVDGTVTARLVALEPSARITGDVSYETLSIAAGAAIEGRLTRREMDTLAAPVAPTPETGPKEARKPKLAKASRPRADGAVEQPEMLAIQAAPAATSA